MAQLPADLVQRLYAAPPDEFVAARAEAIAAAKATGDRAGARLIAQLRKPTVAAWLVNLLAIHRPELVAELVELSGQLRAAQRELRGDDLRALSAHRRQVVSALVAQARSLAVAAGVGAAAGKLPLAEVEATLTAALADVEIAEQVRSGQLIRAVAYVGFGEVPRPRLRLVTDEDAEAADPPASRRAAKATAPDRAAKPAGSARGSEAAASARGSKAAASRPGSEAATPDQAAAADPTPPASAADRAAQAAAAQRAAQAAARRAARERAVTARRRELSDELAVASAELRLAEAELARAAEAEDDAGQAVADIEQALAELQRRRGAAQEEAGRRRLARKGAARAAVAARRRFGTAQAAVEALDEDSDGGRGAPANRVGGAESGR
ncbi:MAG TPA: hypothetical protein VF755_17100 [Catenuloplanes sp.]